MMLLQMNKPSPIPLQFRFLLSDVNFSKRVGKISLLIPEPVSLTVILFV